jgi:predicted nucleic acid-binding protein
MGVINKSYVAAKIRDNHILACALAGKANLIVSRDLDLLRLKRYEGIGFMSSIDFLHTLEGFKKAA